MKRLLTVVLVLFCLLVSPHSVALASPKGVVMNFSEVEIATMVKFISELTGKNFVLDEKVKGKVSVYSPSKLSIDEAFALFTSVLELKGFTLIQTGKIYKVVPSSGAKQAGMKLVDNDRLPAGDSFLARVFPLEQIASQEALTFLQPVISREGHIGSFGPGNMLLVVDMASNLQKVEDILKLIDTPQRREGAELVYLKHGSAEAVAKVLQDWLAGRGSRPVGAGTPGSTGAVQLLADTRLNALLLFGPEKDKQEVRSLITQLDVPPPSASSKVNVHFLEHTDATEMAKVLDGVVKGMTAAAAQPGAAQPTASPFDSGKITITADKATNSLVIMASPTDYVNLLQVIKKLDRRSKQVHVQVLIAEISLDKSRALGVQAGAVAAGVVGKYLQGGGLFDPFNTFGSLLDSSTASGSAISTLITDKLKDASRPVTGMAIVQALESEGLLNVLSTPNILTSDNKEAEIFVGENVPFQGSTTQSQITTTSVERKDIGINLKLKPQISEGDYIRLEINQEISNVKGTIDVGPAGAKDLTTTKRSAKTSIVVRDKDTIVIGGLIQDQENESVNKMPLLGDIPGLGWLFKTTTKTRKKTNLIILLTPQIVKDGADLSKVSEQQRIKFNATSSGIDKLDVPRSVGFQNQPLSVEERKTP